MASMIISASTPQDKNPETWSKKQVNEWFNKKEWLNGWKPQPDVSVNKRSLAIQYIKNKAVWDKVFNFLKSSDLKNLAVGRIEIEGNKAYALVSEYQSKEKAQTRYESHKKYIDIQHIISGQEQMGITTADKVTVAEPYNAEKDIAFFTYEGGDYIKATPANFLVFFPDDVHRPSIKVENNEPIKKIVVKIAVE
jgi:biofilm protein TabA